MRIFKKLFCKHEYKTITNLYGDAANIYNSRSVQQCTKCGKRVYCSLIDPECQVVNGIK